MNKRIGTLLSELKTGLDQIYGRRLKNLYLFGSYARGDQDAESDLDILIVLDHVDKYVQEVNCTGWLVSELSLKYDISISRIFVSEQDWLENKTHFLAKVRGEAIPA